MLLGLSRAQRNPLSVPWFELAMVTGGNLRQMKGSLAFGALKEIGSSNQAGAMERSVCGSGSPSDDCLWKAEPHVSAAKSEGQAISTALEALPKHII